MKKIIILTMLLILATTTFSQQISPSPTLTKQDYLQKSKKQKTAAWWLLGGGLVLSTTSMAIGVGKAADDLANAFVGILTLNPDPAPQKDYTGETILLIAGTAAIVASIPLFIASGKNKKRGMSLSFKNERSLQLSKQNFVYRSVPSINLKFNL